MSVSENTWDERDTQKTSYIWHRNKKIKLEETDNGLTTAPKTPFYPLLNNTEPADCVNLRWSNFRNGWFKQKLEIEHLLLSANADVVQGILSFINDPWLKDEVDAKIPTAIVLPGANIANHLRLFAHIYKEMEARDSLHIARLSSKECLNLKCALRSIVAQIAEGRRGFSAVESAVKREKSVLEATEIGNGLLDNVHGDSDEEEQDIEQDVEQNDDNDDEIEDEHENQDKFEDTKTFKLENNIQNDPGAGMGFGLDDSDELQFDRRLRYDLDILIDWLKRQSPSPKTRIVVSIDDTDSFDISVLVELIGMLHSYITELPIKLIMSVSTTLEVFQSKLPRYCLRKVRGKAFRAEMPDGLQRLLEATMFSNSGAAQFMLGPRVIKSLVTRQSESLESIDTAVASLHYIYMSHFFSNSFSIMTLTTGVDTKFLTGNHFLALRMLPSFRKHIEALVDSDRKLEAKKLLENTSSLIETLEMAVLELQRYSENVLRLLDVLYTYVGVSGSGEQTLLTSKAELYTLIISGDVQQLINIVSGDLSPNMERVVTKKRTTTAGKGNDKDTSEVVRQIKDQVKPYKAFLFHEIFVFDNATLLENVFSPTSRPAIELALTEPSHYWGPGKKPPHICTLYQMYREASVYINIYDYYTSFKESASLVDYESDRQNEDTWPRKSLAWFLQGIAELQHLGIVRDCKRKFECIEKIAWKGL